ncbi:tRNA-dihydrouridine synthase [Candidatus Uhrbacteria bacterium]|nr:tRNA-dihydrouridine synthase [Candidatus Uhrbacteria bacterium]
MKNFWTQLKKPILALAPMAGVTDAAFRPLVKSYGADVIYTEFASTHALIHGNEATRRMIAYQPEEQPVVCQLFGNEPDKFAESAKILESLGFAGVDINFGCPAYKVVTHGGGVVLMKDPEQCRKIVEATCNAVTIPVSVKIRASIKCSPNCPSPSDGIRHSVMDKSKTAVDLVNQIKDLPVAALMIHGRSFEQPFDGWPDVAMITAVRKIFPGILLANGGVYTPEDAKRMLNETGADGIGIARGAWGKPWIFQQVRDYLATGSYVKPTWDEIVAVIIRHAEMAKKYKSAHGFIELRKHLAWYVKGIPHASALRRELVRVKTLEEIITILQTVPALTSTQ